MSKLRFLWKLQKFLLTPPAVLWCRGVPGGLQEVYNNAAVQGMSEGRPGTILTWPVGQTGANSQHQCSVLIIYPRKP